MRCFMARKPRQRRKSQRSATPVLQPLGAQSSKGQQNGQHPPISQPAPTTLQASVNTSPQKRNWTGFTDKTPWDWLNLIGVLLVPLMIGVFTIATTIQQNQISQQQFNNSFQLG